MKKNLLFLSLMAASTILTGQDFSILLVDDSDDNFENTAVISAGLSNNDINFDLFDAQSSNASPSVDQLSEYDLVIWHTSTAQNDLFLWNEQDADNGNLSLYLEQGGNLWLIGVDFLFDRYATPADTFQVGDFVYDYLGIARYDAQAYGDDDNFGVPLVRPIEDQPIPDLVEINWVFPTLWWADVVTPRAEATSIYEMGHDNYVFAGETAGLLYDNSNSRALTFTFDLALANNQGLVDATISSVVDFFASTTVNTESVTGLASTLSVYPNPASDYATLSFELEKAQTAEINIINMTGQRISTFVPVSNLAAGPQQFTWFPNQQVPNGQYHFVLQLDGQVLSIPFALNR